MDDKVEFFMVIGSLFPAGLMVELIAQRVRLPRALAATVFFELLAPVLTRLALLKVQDW